MAYENIDVDKLNQAFNSIGQITCKSVTSLKNKLDDKSKWDSVGRKRIINALEELEKEYSSLLEDISKFDDVVPLIEEYKTLEQENSNYNKQLSIQKSNLSNVSDDDETKSDIQKKISKYSNSIESNNQRKQKIVNQVQNIIN